MPLCSCGPCRPGRPGWDVWGNEVDKFADRLTPEEARINGERGYELANEILGHLSDIERKGTGA